ncbi:hypothetical protein NPX13_g1557 [Xylaria arbuscula]|uniref:Uncharacterized protein n=1 Tax=Xylaria arbuscula TaxID=114810 RepID=A0A9W8TQ07_9PEZI|nr:hypothetical protein NPX13_g1557 [Xylaria arbuscula]
MGKAVERSKRVDIDDNKVGAMVALVEKRHNILAKGLFQIRVVRSILERAHGPGFEELDPLDRRVARVNVGMSLSRPAARATTEQESSQATAPAPERLRSRFLTIRGDQRRERGRSDRDWHGKLSLGKEPSISKANSRHPIPLQTRPLGLPKSAKYLTNSD